MWAIWGCASVLIAFNLAHHAIWLDEAQAWCLVRDSASWAEWRWNMRNEGHPWLWYALLFPLAKGGLPAWSMQALHGVIASTTAAIVIFRAPFPLVVRIAVVFGQFFVFEYAALSRNYALGGLLLLVAAWMDKRSPWRTPALGLLAQTHLWATLVAATWIATELWKQRSASWTLRHALPVLASCGLALACALPTDALPYGPDPARLLDPDHRSRMLRLLTAVVVPWPDPAADHVWGSSLMWRLPAWSADALGIAVLVALTVLLPVRRIGRLRFAACACAILLLPLMAPFHAIRYAGPLVLLAVAVAWMDGPGPHRRPGRRIAGNAVIGALLLLQAMGGILTSWQFARRPFSRAADAVERVRSDGRADLAFVVDRPSLTPAVSAALGRPVLLAADGRPWSFTRWYPPIAEASAEQLLDVAEHHARPGVHVLSRTPIEPAACAARGLRVEVLGTFAGGEIRAEDGVLQRITAW
jgi:hypothetical protein